MRKESLLNLTFTGHWGGNRGRDKLQIIDPNELTCMDGKTGIEWGTKKILLRAPKNRRL